MEIPNIVDGNVKQYSHFGKQYESFCVYLVSLSLCPPGSHVLLLTSGFPLSSHPSRDNLRCFSILTAVDNAVVSMGGTGISSRIHFLGIATQEGDCLKLSVYICCLSNINKVGLVPSLQFREMKLSSLSRWSKLLLPDSESNLKTGLSYSSTPVPMPLP